MGKRAHSPAVSEDAPLEDINPEEQPWWTEDHVTLVAFAAEHSGEKRAAMIFQLRGYARNLTRQDKKCIRNNVNKAIRLSVAPKWQPSQPPSTAIVVWAESFNEPWLAGHLRDMKAGDYCRISLAAKDPGRPLLWHGTSAACVKAIIRHGILPSSEGKGQLGPRSYFADDFETALWYPMEMNGPKCNQLLGECLGTDALPLRAIFEAQCAPENYKTLRQKNKVKQLAALAGTTTLTGVWLRAVESSCHPAPACEFDVDAGRASGSGDVAAAGPGKGGKGGLEPPSSQRTRGPPPSEAPAMAAMGPKTTLNGAPALKRGATRASQIFGGGGGGKGPQVGDSASP